MKSPADWARIRALFHDALERPLEERAAFVLRATGGDTAARGEVESLLAAHSQAGGFLSGPPADAAAAARRASATRRLSPGTRLGAFEIVELLGEGGMGEVYRAVDTRLDRAVAIKVLPPDMAGEPRSRDRFEREARVVSRLSHPHICTLHDVGSAAVDGCDVSFLVMELLEGETLAARLGKGPLPVGLALKVALEILEALAAAHAVGIVHRDLKPANIMMTRSGAKLLDFGLARLRPGSIGAAPPKPAIDDTLSATGLVFGTLPYMAPEQLRGEDTDARTDLFAFGAVLYEMLTGRRAFSAASEPALIAAILEQDPVPLSSLQPLAPRPLENLVHACLAKDRAERWQHAQDLLLSLRSIAEGRAPTDAVPPPATFGFFRRNGPFASFSQWLPHLGWAIVAVVVGLAAWALGRSSDAPVPAANPRPVVVLMDSPLEGRVYDPRTRAAGGTNADDVSDALRDLAIVISKENTSPIWHREEQVIQQNPDLVVSHLSCLFDERIARYDTPVGQHLFDNAQQRLLGFFGYLASNNPRTKFLIYSRGRLWPTTDAEAAWRDDVLARFPKLNDRLFTVVIPGGSGATFRDPRTAQLIRARVARILGLPQ
jgi:serine/threonine protein kinase